MPLPTSGIVTVRLPPADVDDIDEWVEKGRFTNRSDFIRYAVRIASDALAARERDESLDVGTLLEGPGSLRAPDGSRAPARGARNSKKVSRS